MLSKKRPKFQYSEEAMRNAITAVEEGRMSKRAASITYNVPRTTLLDKLTGRTPKERRMGPLPFLTQQEDNDLVQWVSPRNIIEYTICDPLVFLKKYWIILTILEISFKYFIDIHKFFIKYNTYIHFLVLI